MNLKPFCWTVERSSAGTRIRAAYHYTLIVDVCNRPREHLSCKGKLNLIIDVCPCDIDHLGDRVHPIIWPRSLMAVGM